MQDFGLQAPTHKLQGCVELTYLRYGYARNGYIDGHSTISIRSVTATILDVAMQHCSKWRAVRYISGSAIQQSFGCAMLSYCLKEVSVHRDFLIMQFSIYTAGHQK